jgi:hypothetical protein
VLARCRAELIRLAFADVEDLGELQCRPMTAGSEDDNGEEPPAAISEKSVTMDATPHFLPAREVDVNLGPLHATPEGSADTGDGARSFLRCVGMGV